MYRQCCEGMHIVWLYPQQNNIPNFWWVVYIYIFQWYWINYDLLFCFSPQNKPAPPGRPHRTRPEQISDALTGLKSRSAVVEMELKTVLDKKHGHKDFSEADQLLGRVKIIFLELSDMYIFWRFLCFSSYFGRISWFWKWRKLIYYYFLYRVNFEALNASFPLVIDAP